MYRKTMDHIRELSAFQDVLRSADKQHSFAKLKRREGNEVAIKCIVEKVFDFLKEKNYVTVLGIVKENREEYKKLALYLVLNADLPALEEMSGLAGVGALVRTLPALEEMSGLAGVGALVRTLPALEEMSGLAGVGALVRTLPALEEMSGLAGVGALVRTLPALEEMSGLAGVGALVRTLPALEEMSGLAGVGALVRTLPALEEMSGLAGVGALVRTLPALEEMSGLAGVGALVRTLPALEEMSGLAGVGALVRTLPALEEMSGLAGGVGALVRTLPALPGPLLSALLRALHMRPFLYEIVAFCRPALALQLADACIADMQPDDSDWDPRHPVLLAGALYRLTCRLHFARSPPTGASAAALAGLRACLERLATTLSDDPSSNHSEHLHETFSETLSVIKECYSHFTSIEEFEDKYFADIYLATHEPDGLTPKALDFKIRDSPDRAISESLRACNALLLDHCAALMVNVNVDTPYDWSEDDGKYCYILNTILRSIPDVADHRLVGMLEQFPINPQYLSFFIVLYPNPDLIAAKIRARDTTSAAWLTALLDRPVLCRHPTLLSLFLSDVATLDKHQSAQLFDNVSRLMNDSTEAAALQRTVAIEAFRCCSDSFKDRILAEQFRTYFHDDLMTVDFEAALSETFDRLAAGEAGPGDALAVFVQNPGRTLERLVRVAGNSGAQTELMLRVAERLGQCRGRRYKEQTEPTLVLALNSALDAAVAVEEDARRDRLGRFVEELAWRRLLRADLLRRSTPEARAAIRATEGESSKSASVSLRSDSSNESSDSDDDTRNSPTHQEYKNKSLENLMAGSCKGQKTASLAGQAEAKPSSEPLSQPAEAKPSSEPLSQPAKTKPSSEPLSQPAEAKPSSEPLSQPAKTKPSSESLSQPAEAKPSFDLFGQSPGAKLSSGLFSQPAEVKQPSFGLFGKPAEAKPSLGLFGQPDKAKPPFGSFGQPAEVKQPSFGLFDKTAEAKPSFGSFGQPAEVKQPSFGLFGQSPEAKLSSGLFCQLAKAEPSFGSFGQQAEVMQPSFGLFGKTADAKPSFGSFGQSAEVKQPSFGLFGKAAEAKPSFGSFGQSAEVKQPSFGLFGKTAEAKPSFGSFDQSAEVKQPSFGLFGKAAEAKPSFGSFGQSAEVKQPSFGLSGKTAEAKPSFGSFGQSAEVKQPSFGLFGKSDEAKPSLGLIGQPAKEKPSSGSFGKQAEAKSSSLGSFCQSTEAKPLPGLFCQPAVAKPSFGLLGQSPGAKPWSEIFCQPAKPKPSSESLCQPTKNLKQPADANSLLLGSSPRQDNSNERETSVVYKCAACGLCFHRHEVIYKHFTTCDPSKNMAMRCMCGLEFDINNFLYHCEVHRKSTKLLKKTVTIDDDKDMDVRGLKHHFTKDQKKIGSNEALKESLIVHVNQETVSAVRTFDTNYVPVNDEHTTKSTDILAAKVSVVYRCSTCQLCFERPDYPFNHINNGSCGKTIMRFECACGLEFDKHNSDYHCEIHRNYNVLRVKKITIIDDEIIFVADMMHEFAEFEEKKTEKTRKDAQVQTVDLNEPLFKPALADHVFKVNGTIESLSDHKIVSVAINTFDSGIDGENNNIKITIVIEKESENIVERPNDNKNNDDNKNNEVTEIRKSQTNAGEIAATDLACGIATEIQGNPEANDNQEISDNDPDENAATTKQENENTKQMKQFNINDNQENLEITDDSSALNPITHEDEDMEDPEPEDN